MMSSSLTLSISLSLTAPTLFCQHFWQGLLDITFRVPSIKGKKEVKLHNLEDETSDLLADFFLVCVIM